MMGEQKVPMKHKPISQETRCPSLNYKSLQIAIIACVHMYRYILHYLMMCVSGYAINKHMHAYICVCLDSITVGTYIYLHV